MKSPVKIKLIKVDDAPLLTEFATYTFKESWLEEGNEQDLNSYMSEYFNLDRIHSEISSAEISYLIVELNGSPAAYCKLERGIQPEGINLLNPISIGRLYVKKEFQNLGLGSTLIDEALLIAAKEMYKNIWLGVWHKNPDAIRLYERFGFKKIGMYKFVMGSEISDDYIMQRPI